MHSALAALLMLALACLAGSQTVSPEWIIANSAMLHAEMRRHRYGFVVGWNHSGTSLMKALLDKHENISTMHNAPSPEDEGYYVQTAFVSPMRLTERDAHLITETSRLRLYAEWRRYWNVAKPILVEKTPFHAWRMRFLQEMLRHPFGSFFNLWRWPNQPVPADCLKTELNNWLSMQRFVFRDDMQHLNAVAIVFERFVLGDTQDVLNTLLRRFDISPTVTISKMASNSKSPSPLRRDLRGDRNQVAVDTSIVYSWVQSFEERVLAKVPEQCAGVQAAFELSVGEFGYSLYDPYSFVETEVVKPFLLV